MEFMPRPDATKKFGLNWLKWHILKHPNIFMICLPVPVFIYKSIEIFFRVDRELREGVFVPNVIMNRYAICRPTDYHAKITPSRYTN